MIKINQSTDYHQLKKALCFVFYVKIKTTIMKRFLALLILLLFTVQIAQSQITDSLTIKSQQEMYDFYSSKHKKLKKTGWILFGAGLGAAIAGVAIAANTNLFDDSQDDKLVAGAGMFFVGSCAFIASIPVLIVSGSNNRKATAILQSGQTNRVNIPKQNSHYVGVGIQYNF